MKVTILQTDIKWAQPEQNMAVASRLISENPGSDIYVLPEMWNNGFMMEPEKTAESEDGSKSLEWMTSTARKHECAVCGSISVKTMRGEYRNRLYFARPDGTYTYYDKHHLFTYGGENCAFTQGDSRKVVKYGELRFLLLTCYDLRFPLWARFNGDYDTIIFVANWPASRREAWNILLRARAIENQCYVIGANRTGNDPNCVYSGDSMIISPKGGILASSKDKTEQTVTADIDMESLMNFRKKFPALGDRDVFIRSTYN